MTRSLLFSVLVALVCINIVLIFCLLKKDNMSEPFSVLPPEQTEPEPPKEPGKSPIKEEVEPQFVTITKVRAATEDSVYGDVMSHSREAPFGNAHGRGTNVHETNHGLNSWIRNKYSTGKKVNGFYVLKDRGVVLEEPKFSKRQIAQFVPQNLRSSPRFGMYVTGQSAWDSTPLYILDEWVCYVNGGRCDVDDVKAGRYRGSWTDAVSGSLEFSIFAIATAMATQQHDPQYWEQNQQFRIFIIWMLREAHDVFMEGRVMSQFKWDKQDKLLQEFLTSSAAEPMRKFVRENLDGVWLDVDPAVFQTKYESYQCSPYSVEHANRVKYMESKK